MANEAVDGLGILDAPARSDMLKAESLEQCSLTPYHIQKLPEDSSPPVYKYCTPSEWRRLHRGKDPNMPMLAGTFPFLALPAELRNAVYRELLLTTIPLQLVHDRPSWPDVSIPGKRLDPAILRTSKKVSHETLAVLYGENTWYLHMDKTVVRFRADMQRLDPTFRLPPPIPTYITQIKRIVMHAGSTDRTRTKCELYGQLLNIGVRMDNLQLFAIQFPDKCFLGENKRVNMEWLEEVDGRELQKKYVWFHDGTMADEGWLVMKKEKGGEAGAERIPGLGIF